VYLFDEQHRKLVSALNVVPKQQADVHK